MPNYEFDCKDCGTFTLHRAVEERNESAQCPDCEAPAQRIISMPGLSLMAAPQRKAHARNEKSRHAPDVMQRHSCNSRCGCGKSNAGPGSKPKRTVEVPKLGKLLTGRKSQRPWMLGH